MSSTSYWQSEFAASNASDMSAPPLQGNHEADVAIVGAGVTGVAAALWLARAGARVIVLESRRIAAGASGRNGGFLLSGTSESYGVAMARYGQERARRIWDYSQTNHTLAAELIKELKARGWDAGYRRNGSLRIAASEVEMTELRVALPLLARDGWEAELVERRALPRRLRSSYFGAIYYPRDAEVQPVRYVSGLAMLAQRSGAIFHCDSIVTGVAESRHSVIVSTAEGSVRARAVILATNAWLPDLLGLVAGDWLASAIVPTRGQMIVTEPVRERIFSCPCYADDGYQYWRQLRDGRLAVGGWRNRSFATEDTADETPSQQVQRHLDAFVHDALRLPDVGIEQRWAGIMAFSKDGLPLVGRVPGTRHCYLAGGYTGHGNAYAVYAARVVATLIQGVEHDDADLFDPARFAPQPRVAASQRHTGALNDIRTGEL